MSVELEVFFDCSSPWTYLAFSRLPGLADRVGAQITWRPILVGGVFNAVNQDIYEARANPNPVKARYMSKDLADWARYCGLKIGMPPVFPVRAVEAMRGAIFAQDQGRLVPYASAVFEAYWGDLKDISQADVLSEICGVVGLDEAAFFEALQQQGIKDQLKSNTEELITRGGFGSPTIFVNGEDMYFGNDRLPLVEAAAARQAATSD